jgi:RNA polymerase sigma factor (sigma-70 family)
MNRVLDYLRGRSAGLAADTDADLLDRFLADRDEAAFAELVRRHGPVVWGTCRRMLADVRDAEDAFQATFLVLVRRAVSAAREPALGPWLHRVAALTARNVRRGNRRRAAVSGPLEYDVPAGDNALSPADARLDLDAALLRLPDRHRAAVVLCHLQGLSRREAAERLGCPEGTLSALLSRALARLRVKLGRAVPAALVTAIPTGLTAATARSAVAYAISATTDLSPAVTGLTEGVLRMFWLKKAVPAAAAAVVLGVLAAFVGLSSAPAVPATTAANPQTPNAVEVNPADDDLKDLVPTHVEGRVTDADGKPIAGARVSIDGTIGYAATFGMTEFNARGTTGRDGTYKLGFKTKPGTVVTITGITAEADGYVAHRERFHFDELKTTPGTPGKWDFVLAKGEVIAGRVAGAGEMVPVLVRGPSFSRIFFTDKDGAFRFWVPKGTYTVTAAVEVKPQQRDKALADDHRVGYGVVIGRAATATKVTSGTENLLLKAP